MPVKFATTSDLEELPILQPAPTFNYYTQVSPSEFALVASWASTIVGNVSAPLLILFSFVIARSIWRRQRAANMTQDPDEEETVADTEQRIRELLHSRTYMKLWKWFKATVHWSNRNVLKDEALLAAIGGLSITLLFS